MPPMPRNRDIEFRVARQLRNHIQRDRFDRRSAVTAVRRLSVDVRIRNHRVDIDAHHRIYRVYQRNRVRAAFLRRASRRNDVRDVRRELYDHRQIRNFLDPFGDHAGVFGNLSHRRAHSALAHSVRAAEIQLKTVRSPCPATRLTISCHASRFDSTIRETITA